MEKVVKHVKTMFGWHGGMGDPPPDDAIIAIIRGADEFRKWPGKNHDEKKKG